MSGKARVTYWAGRGRCEPLRMILAAGGVLMEHNVLTAVDGAQALRALRESGKLAYDQVPLVEIDGLNLVQGTPTAQYIAQRCALWPSTPEAQYRAGAVFEALRDVLCALGALMGRRYRTTTDLRTNLYIVGIADSGSGKNHAREVVNHAGDEGERGENDDFRAVRGRRRRARLISQQRRDALREAVGLLDRRRVQLPVARDDRLARVELGRGPGRGRRGERRGRRQC